MIKRLLLLFSISFILLTTLDIGTTWVGIHYRGYEEVNVFTDTTSLGAMVRPDIWVLMLGAVAVLVGALWKRGTLQASVDQDFRGFLEAFWSVRQLPAAILIFLPICLAVGRALPVLSNAMYLLVGWSPMGSALQSLSHILGWGLFRTNMIINGVLLGLLAIPVMYVIYLTCRSGREHKYGDVFS